MGCNSSKETLLSSSPTSCGPPKIIICSTPPKAIVCKANDRASLVAALDSQSDSSDNDISSDTMGSESRATPVIYIVRSDKLTFPGTGIRRHSKRKRKRHSGADNTRIVVLRQSMPAAV